MTESAPGAARAVETMAAGIPEGPFDAADWVEWDHWQAEAEFQDLVDGLGDDGDGACQDLAISDPDSSWVDAVSRRLRRHGVEIAG